MICPYCQFQQKDDAKFCNQCGSILVKMELTRGTLLDNRYEVLMLVKKGGMGAVYKVKDRRLMDTICALKEMLDNFDDDQERAEAISWFKREAEILCRELRHPNIPVVKDFFIEKGRYYLVMDFIEGNNLESIPLPMNEKQALDFALEALEILAYLHKKKIIHRDIKPENFMLEKDTGKLFLVDFGTATLFSTRKTKTAVGTVGYASPEHYEGKQEERSDIYSFGATLHRLVTGTDPKIRPPFQFGPVRSINPKISEAFAKVVEKALQYKPEDRYQSVLEMKKAFENLAIPAGEKPLVQLQNQPAASYLQVSPGLFNQEPSVSIKMHDGCVFAVAFSPDGRLIATTGGDCIARIWDISTEKEVCSWSDHLDEVRSAAFSPDGRFLATGSGDTTIKVREVFSSGKIITLSGHSDKVTCVLFSPGGKLLASGSQDKKVCLWDTGTWKKTQTVSEHKNWITALSFSPRGKILATSSIDSTENLLDSKTGKVLATINLAPETIHSSAFYPVNNYPYLACGLGDGSIRIWDVKKGSMITRINGHKGKVLSLSFTSDGKLLASGSEDRLVRIWDNQGKCILSLPEHSGSVLSICFSPNGKILASGSEDGNLRIFNIPELIQQSLKKKVDTPRTLISDEKSTNPPSPSPAVAQTHILPSHEDLKGDGLSKAIRLKNPLMTLEGHEEGARCAAFTSDSRILAVGTGNGSIKIWDLTSQKELNQIKKSDRSLWSAMSNWIKGIPTAHSECVTAVIFSPDDHHLISASCDSHLILWRCPIQKGEKSIFVHLNELFCVALSGNGEKLAVGSKGEILLFRLESGELIKENVLEAGNEWINTVAFTPEGKILASGDDNGCICLWNLISGKLMKEFKEHNQKVLSVAFSPDGKRVISGSMDSTIKILDLQKVAITMTIEDLLLKDRENAILTVKFSPCGRFIASAGEDCTAKLWDYSSGTPLFVLEGHQKRINELVFSSDKKLMATCAEDGKVKIWEIP